MLFQIYFREIEKLIKIKCVLNSWCAKAVFKLIFFREIYQELVAGLLPNCNKIQKI
jgi:hypothetical protein